LDVGKDKNEIIEKVVIENEQVKPSTSDYSEVKKQILDKLFSILDKEKGSFVITSHKMIELKELLKPLSKHKGRPRKPEVIEILKEKFFDGISIEEKEKKYIISRKT
jgi:hypothetical protein